MRYDVLDHNVIRYRGPQLGAYAYMPATDLYAAQMIPLDVATANYRLAHTSSTDRYLTSNSSRHFDVDSQHVLQAQALQADFLVPAVQERVEQKLESTTFLFYYILDQSKRVVFTLQILILRNYISAFMNVYHLFQLYIVPHFVTVNQSRKPSRRRERTVAQSEAKRNDFGTIRP